MKNLENDFENKVSFQKPSGNTKVGGQGPIIPRCSAFEKLYIAKCFTVLKDRIFAASVPLAGNTAWEMPVTTAHLEMIKNVLVHSASIGGEVLEKSWKVLKKMVSLFK